MVNYLLLFRWHSSQLFFLQIDDVKCDERPRYNGSVDGGGGRGFCREHTKFGMDVTSYDDVLMWKECCDKGEAHLAKEITCVALGPLRKPDHSAHWRAAHQANLGPMPVDLADAIKRKLTNKGVDELKLLKKE
jgi:hypothetical protein